MSRQVYVIGGASGIGRALALMHAADGDNVSVFDRVPAQAVLTELRARARVPEQVFSAWTLDVGDAEGVSRVMAEAAAAALPDLVIHCAGIVTPAAFADLPAAEFTRIVHVNLNGSAYVAAALLPFLRPGSHMVFMASMAGLVGCYGYAAYGASKAGVVGLAEVLRLEWRARGIDVSVVCPPEVETPMVEQERTVRPRQTEVMKLMAGSLPLDVACHRIHGGIAARRFLIIPGWRARMVWLGRRLLPAFSQWVADRVLASVGRAGERMPR